MTEKQPHYIGHRERLRERFLKAGFAGFADHEKVEILLTLCIPRGDVKQRAKQLLERFGNIRRILDASPEELQKVKGIGEVTPIAFRIIREAANLYLQQKAEDSVIFDSPELIKTFWRSRLGGLPNEVFEVAYLDSGLRLMKDGIERLEEGTIDRAAVYPRRVMEAAIKRGAAALIVAHNHTNRKVDPTEQDKVLTKALILAATTLQVRIIDHMIISADEIFSFREAGLL